MMQESMPDKVVSLRNEDGERWLIHGRCESCGARFSSANNTRLHNAIKNRRINNEFRRAAIEFNEAEPQRYLPLRALERKYDYVLRFEVQKESTSETSRKFATFKPLPAFFVPCRFCKGQVMIER